MRSDKAVTDCRICAVTDSHHLAHAGRLRSFVSNNWNQIFHSKIVLFIKSKGSISQNRLLHLFKFTLDRTVTNIYTLL